MNEFCPSDAGSHQVQIKNSWIYGAEDGARCLIYSGLCFRRLLSYLFSSKSYYSYMAFNSQVQLYTNSLEWGRMVVVQRFYLIYIYVKAMIIAQDPV